MLSYHDLSTCSCFFSDCGFVLVIATYLQPDSNSRPRHREQCDQIELLFMFKLVINFLGNFGEKLGYFL